LLLNEFATLSFGALRGMSDDLVDKTVVLRMNKNFMKFMNLNYPWTLK